MLFDATGLPFVPPSLNLRTLESLHHYPGLCLFEGTNLSVGRGSDAPFEQVGAPWIDTTALLGTLRRNPPPGVSFSGVAFTPQSPGDGKYSDTLVMGVRLRVTNRDTYDPTLTAAFMLSALQATHSTTFAFRPAQFDRLAGGPALRTKLERGVEVSTIAATWREQRTGFILRRRPYLLYAE
jgi:uncharacterized protein YbbC (DUF1343 family)